MLVLKWVRFTVKEMNLGISGFGQKIRTHGRRCLLASQVSRLVSNVENGFWTKRYIGTTQDPQLAWIYTSKCQQIGMRQVAERL